jgi:transcription initiation factor TFIID subunit 3
VAISEANKSLAAMKKKHSKTGEESRFQGTVLGKEAEARPVKIDGGPESLQEWHERVRERSAKLNASRAGNGYTAPLPSTEDSDMAG